ncbi:MAG TPA: GNAT family N-acetyltransferase [Bryobacteraceae bacterium]|nr:GNAT family N-acetyltransferase [Bryobacteraceae bacterium]HPT27459.1 GNAT family N-acetyltransferase [Bryobacteraceae bacterium]
MAERITIDRARPDEAEWCAAVMADTDPWVTLGRTYEASLVRLKREGSELFVARRGDVRLGFILMDRYGVAGSPYIASVACTAEARGRGIGSALLEFAERLYPDARHIFLCVSSFNAEARRLYERRGYTLTGTLKDYAIDGADEFLMTKRLDAR